METVKWIAGGKKVEYTVSLVLSRRINLDGDVSVVPCCEIETSVKVEGMSYVSSSIQLMTPVVVGGKTVVANMGGVLGLTQSTLDDVNAAIAKVERLPEWVAKQATIAKNREEIADMDARRRRNGYCYKCGSYCYGDCEAGR